jgi:hypothetical protein
LAAIQPAEKLNFWANATKLRTKGVSILVFGRVISSSSFLMLKTSKLGSSFFFWLPFFSL